MSKKENGKSGVDPQVWIALIGLASLIVTSIVAPIVMKSLDITPTPGANATSPGTLETATAPGTVETAIAPTTGSAVTEPAAVTSLASTSEPGLAPGEDWANNCIDRTLWQVYPTDAAYTLTGNCIQPPANWGMVFTPSGLTFINPNKPGASYYGITTPVSSGDKIEFTLGVTFVNQGDLRIGFTKPGFAPGKYGIFLTPKENGSVEVIEVMDNKRITRWQQQFGEYPQRFTFAVENGFLTISAVDKNGIAYSTGELNNLVLPPTREFFVGFEAYRTSFDALAFITDLSISAP